jgi:gliding motility-associated-like protein
VTVPNAVRTGTPPTVDFTADTTKSCASNPIRFTSLATPSTQWLWDFGDGTGDTAQNPIHQFQKLGNLSVTHIGYNNGCRAARTKSVTILSPFAKFQDTVLNCADRYTVTFLDKSEVDPANPVKYLWKFTASDSSTQKSPSFTFPTPGNYPVSLTLDDPVTGCRFTATRTVPLIYEKAQFTASKTTVCKNERFSLSATGDGSRISEYRWRLGNGAYFIGNRSIDTSFDTNGTHSISLIIRNSYGGCTDTVVVSDLITVIGPTAAFTNDSGSCLSKSVTFQDQSTTTSRVTKWTWDFGDGTIQSFTTVAPFIHLYRDTGTYSVKLTVEDDKGCIHTVAKNGNIVITKPEAHFKADSVYCPGVPLQFRDSSQGRNLSYSWNFGDGGTSNVVEPAHAYTANGSPFTVKLKVIDAFGCGDSLTRTNYVNIRSPKSAFAVTDTVTICPPLETKFKFQGKDYESFLWDFGDGTGSTLQDPTHFYNTHGTFIAKLYVYGYGGCVDSSSHNVNLYDPVRSARIAYTAPDACNSLKVDFTITTPAFTKFTFLPGDGSADSSQNKTPSHFYNSPNYFLPTILLSDNVGCQGFIGGPVHIKILGAIPNFGRDRKEFCDSGVVYFTNYTIANDPIVSSVWNFDDGTTTTDQDPVHYFARPDQYAVSLNVTTRAGCSSSITDTIKAYRTPVPSITNINPACINSPVAFNGNLAVADTAITWKWDLGNGQNSSQQNATSVYTKDGPYKISVEAANRLGCKNSATTDLTVAPLPVITMGPDPVIPVGTGVDLPVTYNSNMILYTWTPTKDLNCTNCAVPYANPKFTTRYKISVTDSNNCKSSSDVTVNVVCNNKNYFVPNTFTPNGDGVNDVFYPRGSSIDRIQSMRIFNRWGQVVFEKKNFTANNLSEGWNGMFQGRPANTDTYIYTIEFVCENGEIIPYKGNVTLLR